MCPRKTAASFLAAMCPLMTAASSLAAMSPQRTAASSLAAICPLRTVASSLAAMCPLRTAASSLTAVCHLMTAASSLAAMSPQRTAVSFLAAMCSLRTVAERFGYLGSVYAQLLKEVDQWAASPLYCPCLKKHTVEKSIFSLGLELLLQESEIFTRNIYILRRRYENLSYTSFLLVHATI